MKNKKLIVLFLILLCMAGCSVEDELSSSGITESLDSCISEAVVSEEESTEDNEGAVVYDELMKETHVDINTAYERLVAVAESDGEISEFVQTLAELKNCQGRFLQESEETDNTYTADVEFYLSNGEIWATVDYTNYSGELGDGIVQTSREDGYLFESFPKGTFYGSEHDFQIYFSPDRLYIAWADTCEYTLTRGYGSVEDTIVTEKAFEETTTYEALDSVLREAFSDWGYQISYDEAEMEVNMYIQAPENTRTALRVNAEAVESWRELVGSLTDVADSLHAIATVGYDGPQSSSLYIVDEINDSGRYGISEYLLLIEDGVLIYNFADDITTAGASGGYSSTPNHSTETATATMGERNAVEKAKDYLRFMAFSYSGLIEQLEYEGFSYSEAVYGADHCGADWYEQAAKKAKEYLDFMSFSRAGLIDQLEYEGFTTEQAIYGVEQNGY